MLLNRLLMKRRREHGECEAKVGGRGCVVLGTPVCTFRKVERRWWMRMSKRMWSFVQANPVLLWLVIALLGIVVAGSCIRVQKGSKEVEKLIH